MNDAANDVDVDVMEKKIDVRISRLRWVCRCSTFCEGDEIAALSNNILQSSSAPAAAEAAEGGTEEESVNPRAPIPVGDGMKDRAWWEKEDSISAKKQQRLTVMVHWASGRVLVVELW